MSHVIILLLNCGSTNLIVGRDNNGRAITQKERRVITSRQYFHKRVFLRDKDLLKMIAHSPYDYFKQYESLQEL